jgi:hypothetical protein
MPTSEKRNRPTITISLDPNLVREVEALNPRTLPMSRKVEGLLKAGLQVKKVWETKHDE